MKQIVENHPTCTFAGLVDGMLQSKAISITKFAKNTGLNRRTIRRIIKGEITRPEKKTIIIIGIELGLTLSEIGYLLYRTSNVFDSDSSLDKLYMNVIYDTYGKKNRLDDCNEKLSDKGVADKDLLWGKSESVE